MRVVVFLLVFLASCAVADEDEIAALEKRIAELERELEDAADCEDELAKTLYQISYYKEMAENCVDEKLRVRRGQ